MSRTLWKNLMVAVFATMAAVAVGCDGEDEPTPTPTPENARLRVVHASPDAPAVDVYAQGQTTPLFTNVAYGAVTDYVEVAPGNAIIELRAAGAAPTSAPVYATDSLTIAPAAEITAVAAGLLASQAPESSFRVLPYLEEFAATDQGTARVRIIHAGADAPAVGLDVENDGVIEVQNLERFADTGATGVALPAGQSLQLGIVAGTPAEPVTAFTLPALTAGAELFVVATGLLEEKPREEAGFALLAVGEQGRIGLVRQNPMVYALHASPDTPGVDIFAANSELADNLIFGNLTARIQVPPGVYSLDFFAHQPGNARPMGPPAATRETPMLMAGERYLVVASGFLGASDSVPGFTLLAYSEGFVEAQDGVRLRVVHASPDAPPVDVGPLTGGLMPMDPPFQDLAFSQASPAEGLQLEPIAITAGVSPADDAVREPVASFALDLGAFAGQELFGVAAGALAPRQGQEGFRLLVVNTSARPWSVVEVEPQ